MIVIGSKKITPRQSPSKKNGHKKKTRTVVKRILTNKKNASKQLRKKK